MLIYTVFAFATSVSALAIQQPTSPAQSHLDLKHFFLDDFASASEELSPSDIVEMIPKSGSSSLPSSARTTTAPFRQEMFTSPLISFLYERVLPPLWAAGLRIGGPDEEYENAATYLVPQQYVDEDNNEPTDGEVALDLSCGTGFVGIRMAKSGNFQHVFALDYSAQMLNEVVATVKRDTTTTSKRSLPLSIIRGDAGRLPFRDCVIDAVHWGAAMHCVPDAEQAMKEVYRVLKPGGRLYATTFLRPFPDVVFRFFDLAELEGIAMCAGFGTADDKGGGELEVEALRKVYGVIRATKGRK